jgi:hypothetical protein
MGGQNAFLSTFPILTDGEIRVFCFRHDGSVRWGHRRTTIDAVMVQCMHSLALNFFLHGVFPIHTRGNDDGASWPHWTDGRKVYVTTYELENCCLYLNKFPQLYHDKCDLSRRLSDGTETPASFGETVLTVHKSHKLWER